MRLIVLLLLIGAGILLAGRFGSAETLPALGLPVLGPAATPLPARAAAATARPGTGETAVEISEAELSRQFGQRLVGVSLGQTPLGRASIERIQVSLRSGRADTSGSARLGENSVPFTGLFTVTPDGTGRVRTRLVETRVGGIALPEASRAELEAVVQRDLDNLLGGPSARVRSVEIGDGRLRAIMLSGV